MEVAEFLLWFEGFDFRVTDLGLYFSGLEINSRFVVLFDGVGVIVEGAVFAFGEVKAGRMRIFIPTDRFVGLVEGNGAREGYLGAGLFIDVFLLN